jgi:CubicO group peptidase (beta-lactamase class C family)
VSRLRNAFLDRLLIATALFFAGLPIGAAALDPEQFRDFVAEGMELWHVPGLAVAVVGSDRTEFKQGFGVSTIDNGVPVDEHTLFANASTTKAMVAAGLMILVDDGALSLDDAVTKHLPELRFEDPLLTRDLTVRDLLTHRTGLPSTDFWAFFQNMPLDEQVRRLAAVKPVVSLRTRHIYQNTMYELVGLVIERISGQRWDRFLAERLWRPIGMHDTVGSRARIPDGMAHVLPHSYLDERLEVTDWDLPADVADAAGSAWTSLHDMALWAQFLLRGGVTATGERLIFEERFADYFRPQHLIAADDFYPTAELTQPHWITYALGWFQQDFQGRQIDFHTGSLSGLIAIIGLDRAQDRAVVVLGNRDHAELRHAVLWEVMDNAPTATRRDWNADIVALYEARDEDAEQRWRDVEAKRLEDTRPALPLAAYAGHFESPVLGELAVEAGDGGLRLRSALLELPLSHWHLDTFLLDYRPWHLREFLQYRVGPEGAADSFTLFGETFTKVADGDRE